MNHNLFEVEQRVKRYWYTDGIGELISGGMFVLLGIYFAAQQYLGENSLAGGLLQAGLIFFLLGGMAGGRWLIKQLKSRLTYPRSGYVEYQVDRQHLHRRWIVAAGVGFLIAALSMILSRQFSAFLDTTLFLTGILVGVILIFLQGKSSGLERFYVLGGISMALGTALSLSGMTQGYGLGLFYSLMGIAFAISGALVLRRYLQENPAPAETQDE